MGEISEHMIILNDLFSLSEAPAFIQIGIWSVVLW